MQHIMKHITLHCQTSTDASDTSKHVQQWLEDARLGQNNEKALKVNQQRNRHEQRYC